MVTNPAIGSGTSAEEMGPGEERRPLGVRLRDLAGSYRRDLIINGILASGLVPRLLRGRLLAASGMRVSGASISPNCWFGDRTITIGSGSFVNYGCFFDNLGPIEIGANCRIGMQVMFCTSTHTIGPSSKRGGAFFGKGIAVGNGVWIGARALILPGVTIGDGCIIAAGALVLHGCEPNGLYAGSPARRVRDLD